MKVLDLFSGIGGFTLGLEKAGMKTIAFCEMDSFCRKVLVRHWPNIPIACDIKNLNYINGILYENEKVIYEGKIDLVCGGFPCQPFSIAGRRKGTQDDRYLWPAMFRIIRQAKPIRVICENVTHFANMAFTRTKTDLESEGYTVQPFIIPACAVGAPHRRDRIWVIAYTDSERRQGSLKETLPWKPTMSREFKGGYKEWRNGWPVSASRVCGVDDGVPYRSHRLKALGNSVVPQIPEIIGKAINIDIRRIIK